MRLSRRAEPPTTGSIAGFSQTSRTRPSAGVVMCPRTKAIPGSWRKRYGDAGGRPRLDGRRLWLFPSRQVSTLRSVELTGNGVSVQKRTEIHLQCEGVAYEN